MDGDRNLTMRAFGCVVTDCAMILTDFLKRDVLPIELLRWLKANGGIDKNKFSSSYGGIFWQKISDYTNGKLKFGAGNQNEATWAIRQVYLGRYNHYVLKGPDSGSNISDPLDGKLKGENSYTYTGKIRLYSGIPVNVQEYRVDHRYGLAYNPLREARFKIPLPGTPALTIKNRIGRLPTQREVNGLVYGKWSFEEVFKNSVGTKWLNEIKQ